ncbi:MAG TPA: hypothetical protein VF217_01505 [Rhodanobacteraceae bacterium]
MIEWIADEKGTKNLGITSFAILALLNRGQHKGTMVTLHAKLLAELFPRNGPPIADRIRSSKNLALMWAEWELSAFRATGMGVFAWRVYDILRLYDLPIAPEVLAYFDKCSLTIRHAAGQRVSPSKLAAGLGLRPSLGGAGAHKAAKDIERQRTIYWCTALEYRLVGTNGEAKSRREARDRVAAIFKTTGGAVHQLEMKWRSKVKPV